MASKSASVRASKKGCPKARSNPSELIFQEVEDELVVYDVRRQRFYDLNTTAVSVWRLCDGLTSPEQMAVSVRMGSALNEEQALAVVGLALDQLSREGLLETDNRESLPASPSPRRRNLIKATGGVISLPVISSLLAPPAAAQFSVPCLGCGGCLPPNNFACWSPTRGCYCTRNCNQCRRSAGTCCP
jgi:hypothetical protein